MFIRERIDKSISSLMNYPVETMRPDSTELISFAIDINGEKYLKKLNVRVTSVDGIIKDLIDEHHLVSDPIYTIRSTQPIPNTSGTDRVRGYTQLVPSRVAY